MRQCLRPSPRRARAARVSREASRMVKRGIVLHPADPAWRSLELAFLSAERRALDAIKARLQGELVPTPTPVSEPTGLTLTAALRRWADGGGRGATRPRSGSAAEAE